MSQGPTVSKDLTQYRQRRHAGRTPEPIPEPSTDSKPSPDSQDIGHAVTLRFVVQEHHARRLHWDFRLERDGVLVSWAVPKGLPLQPGQQRLAVHTEDHPMEYATFAGEIPRGEYGGGTVSIWDHGTYQLVKWDEGHVEVVLRGRRVRGRYLLIRINENNWLLRRRDPSTDPQRQAAPHISPMLATAGDLPSDAGLAGEWGYEFKWDGVRTLVRVEGGRARAWGRTKREITHRYPELRAFAEALGSTELIVDGELVAFDQNGRPSFGALQHRMHLDNEREIRRVAREVPVSYLIFDLLQVNGHSQLETPYRQRRELLESLELAGPHWLVPPYYRDSSAVALGEDGPSAGSGSAVLRASRKQGLEGVVAKRLASSYQAGLRSADWIKVVNLTTQEVVIGGWREGAGQFHGQLGALLLGVYPSSGDTADGAELGGLRYIGDVGTGFSDSTRVQLTQRLRALHQETSPFADPLPRDRIRGAQWVRPELVGEVRYRTMTSDGRLRHAAWRGLRSDKTPTQVRTLPVETG
ncbi:MAG: DNA ligase [Acidimicrobiales bacterium]|nr:MAG: DNA ligase [Acidimicrobiales bacterium]